MPEETKTREIGKALGLPIDVEFRGQTWHLEPLTFLDLGHAEQLGLIEHKKPSDAKPNAKPGDDDDTESGMSVTTIMWLMLRKADPRLTETQRDFCKYIMTPREAAAVFAFGGTDAGDVGKFMAQVMAASGLNATPEEGTEDAEEGTAPKGQTEKKAARAKKPAPSAIPTAE